MKLNLAVKYKRHLLASVGHTIGQMAGEKVFSKLDANSGFHQIPLAQDSQLLTPFITPFGCYCYRRLPFGINSGPEHYQLQIHKILQNTPGVICLMDDIVVYGCTEDDHDSQLDIVLKKLSSAGITLSKEKCSFKQSEISFLGQIIGANGVRGDPQKVQAIIDLPQPQDMSEMRHVLGMVNQLGKLIPDLATVTDPLRALLKDKAAWLWGPAQDTAFSKLKTLLTCNKTLKLYDPSLCTKVMADSSSYGLGAVLSQKSEDGTWHPVAYESRSLSLTEKRYAQVDKEALASAWVCNRFEDYLIGLKFILETDHKPPVALLGTKSLDELSARIQRMRMHLMQFSYVVIHIPGKELYTADTLSLEPLEKCIPPIASFTMK